MITGMSRMLNIKNIHKEGLIMADQTLPLDVSYEMNKNETGQEKRT